MNEENIYFAGILADATGSTEKVIKDAATIATEYGWAPMQVFGALQMLLASLPAQTTLSMLTAILTERVVTAQGDNVSIEDLIKGLDLGN